MYSGLISGIEDIDASGDDGELARSLSVARDRLEARLCETLVGFFSAGRHDVEGWRSPVGWLKANAGLTDRDAKRLRRASTGWAGGRCWPARGSTGEVSGAQVEVVVALVPRPLVDLFAEHDAEVSPCLIGLSAADTRLAVREWVLRAEAVTAPGPWRGRRGRRGRCTGCACHARWPVVGSSTQTSTR